MSPRHCLPAWYARADPVPELQLDRRRLTSAIVMIVALAVVACRPAPAATPNATQPARLEAIEGSDVKRVVLTAEAAARIGIKTSAVLEHQVVRKRTVGGEVLSLDAGALLFVQATPSDLTKIDRGQPALVRPIVGRDGAAAGTANAIPARPVDRPASVTTTSAALYYVVDGRAHGLARGQRVLLEVPLLGGAAVRKVVPYSAVLYDLAGATWTYTQPAALSFVRHRVAIDYIEGDQAILAEGPVVGTEVVVVGATELFGTEFKVGK